MSANKIANDGDHTLFKRNNLSINGVVVKVKESSVVVKVSNSDAERLQIDTPYTVVSHKNYKIVYPKGNFDTNITLFAN